MENKFQKLLFKWLNETATGSSPLSISLSLSLWTRMYFPLSFGHSQDSPPLPFHRLLHLQRHLSVQLPAWKKPLRPGPVPRWGTGTRTRTRTRTGTRTRARTRTRPIDRETLRSTMWPLNACKSLGISRASNKNVAYLSGLRDKSRSKGVSKLIDPDNRDKGTFVLPRLP